MASLTPAGLYEHTYEVLRVARNALDPLPGRAFLNPGGPVPWDSCCEGQVWVRIISITPVLPRNAGPASSSCPVGWRLVLGVGALRCVEVVRDDGTPPTAREVTDDAQQMMEDAANLLNALTCSDLDLALGQWGPVGADGGCAGGEVQVTSTLMFCGC